MQLFKIICKAKNKSFLYCLVACVSISIGAISGCAGTYSESESSMETSAKVIKSILNDIKAKKEVEITGDILSKKKGIRQSVHFKSENGRLHIVREYKTSEKEVETRMTPGRYIMTDKLDAATIKLINDKTEDGKVNIKLEESTFNEKKLRLKIKGKVNNLTVDTSQVSTITLDDNSNTPIKEFLKLVELKNYLK